MSSRPPMRRTLGSPPGCGAPGPGRRTSRSTVAARGQDGGMTSPGDGSNGAQQVVVVGPDGRPVGAVAIPQGPDDDGDGASGVGEMVEQPAKVMRIGTMIKQLLEEVR